MDAAARLTIFVTGASGLLGESLIAGLIRDGHPVVGLTRRARGRDRAGVEWVEGDVTRTGAWMDAISGCGAVVHLAGESIGVGRFSAARKRRMRASRIEAAERIVEALHVAPTPPPVLVSASASGYYGARGDELLREASAPGDDFLARLCVDWEAASLAARKVGTRVVALRFGVVLSRKGGALARMWPLFRAGLGGPLGPGDRYFPWIHVSDAVGLIRAAMDPAATGWHGPINAVAPESVTMARFAQALGAAAHRPARIAVPLWLLEGVLGEAATGLVAGQRLEPARATQLGYRFAFPTLDRALEDLAGAGDAP